MSETDGIIRQIDEEVKRERILGLLGKFKYHILAIVGSVLLMVWGTTAYLSMKEQRAQQQGRQLLTALDTKDAPAEFLAALAPLLETGSDGYKALAKFQRAAVLSRDGKPAQAKQIYQDLETTAPNADLRDLASLMWVYVAFEEGGDLTARLTKLLRSTWRDSARELEAFLALKAGDTAKAKELFKALDSEVNLPGVKRRASEMLILLEPQNE